MEMSFADKFVRNQVNLAGLEKKSIHRLELN